jgi:uncharacterized protein (DUF952 family)
MENIIFHITQKEWFEKWEEKDYYESLTYYEEGFIHLSQSHQVSGVLDRYFTGIPNLVKLHIDVAKLTYPLKYEESTDGELFPHLYGVLNKEAIIEVEEL